MNDLWKTLPLVVVAYSAALVVKSWFNSARKAEGEENDGLPQAGNPEQGKSRADLMDLLTNPARRNELDASYPNLHLQIANDDSNPFLQFALLEAWIDYGDGADELKNFYREQLRNPKTRLTAKAFLLDTLIKQLSQYPSR